MRAKALCEEKLSDQDVLGAWWIGLLEGIGTKVDPNMTRTRFSPPARQDIRYAGYHDFCTVGCASSLYGSICLMISQQQPKFGRTSFAKQKQKDSAQPKHGQLSSGVKLHSADQAVPHSGFGPKCKRSRAEEGFDDFTPTKPE